MEITQTKAPRYQFTPEDRKRAVAVRLRNLADRESARAKVLAELRTEMAASLGHEPSGIEKAVFDSVLLILASVRIHALDSKDSAASRRELRATLRDARLTLQAVSGALRLLRTTADGGFEPQMTNSEKRERYWARLQNASAVGAESEHV